MRILYIINDLRLAGAERFVADIAPYQKASGLDVSVATLAPYGSAFEEEIKNAGIPLLMPSRPHPFRSPAHVPRLQKLFAGYDLVHVQLFPAQLWAVLAAQMMGKTAPILLTTEHNTHNTRRNIPALRSLDRWMYRRYAHIAAISDGTRDALVEHLPETAGKISVIHNGIDLQRFTEPGSPDDRARLFPQVPVSSPLLLCIGRLEPQKDFPNLFRAMTKVPGVHLAIVGVGSLQAELQELSRALALAERVHFLGQRNDIPALLRNADLYVQASAWEGFGIAAVEAMASGLPLVITDVAGLREVVSDAGVRVPPGDPDSLARALTDLLADERRRADLSRRARTRAQSFTIATCAGAYRQLYEKLVLERLPLK